MTSRFRRTSAVPTTTRSGHIFGVNDDPSRETINRPLKAAVRLCSLSAFQPQVSGDVLVDLAIEDRLHSDLDSTLKVQHP